MQIAEQQQKWRWIISIKGGVYILCAKFPRLGSLQAWKRNASERLQRQQKKRACLPACEVVNSILQWHLMNAGNTNLFLTCVCVCVCVCVLIKSLHLGREKERRENLWSSSSEITLFVAWRYSKQEAPPGLILSEFIKLVKCNSNYCNKNDWERERERERERESFTGFLDSSGESLGQKFCEEDRQTLDPPVSPPDSRSRGEILVGRPYFMGNNKLTS